MPAGGLEGQVALVTGAGRGVGPISLLVNNAGTREQPGPLWEADPDGGWRDLEVHVRGAFHCCRAVVPGMVRRGGALLVRVAAGEADRLSGRFLHVDDDLDELVADAGRIEADDLLTLRLRERVAAED